jgi:uncharacterized protein (DUF1778 family)
LVSQCEYMNRPERINVRASSAEVQMLRALAERDGLSGSDFLRLYIRRAYAVAFGEEPASRDRETGRAHARLRSME